MELSLSKAVDTNSHRVLNIDLGYDHGADLLVHDQGGEGEVGAQSLSHGADLSVHDQGEGEVGNDASAPAEAPPTAPVQMSVDPLDEGIPGAEPPLVLQGPELSEPEEYQDGWQCIRFIQSWRDGQQLFLVTADNGGYIINYTFDPARVSK